MEKTNPQKYQEREKRLLDAIALKEPDRVPIVPLFAFFNCYYSGISPREAYTVPKKRWKPGERPFTILPPMPPIVSTSRFIPWTKCCRVWISKP